MSETKRQTIVLLHGSEAFSAQKAAELNLRQGELVVEHGVDGAKLHTLDKDGALATFVSETAVNDKIAVVNSAVTAVAEDLAVVEEVLNGDGEKQGLIADVADNAAAIEALQDALGTGDATGETITSRVESLEALVGNPSDEANNIEAEGVFAEVEKNAAAIEDLATTHATDKGELDASILELEKTLTGYSSEATVKAAIEAQAEAQNNALTAATSAINATISGVTGRVETLEETAETQGDNISALQGVLSGYTEEGSVAAAVAAAKSVVVAADGQDRVTVSPSTAEDGHVIYTVNVADFAAGDDFKGLEEKVDTLIGSDANKSVRTIANEELAAQLLSGDAEADFKSLQELAAWLESHPEDVTAMNAERAALEAALDGFVKRTEDGALVAEAETIKKKFEAVNKSLEDLENQKVAVSTYNDKMEALDKKDGELNNAITAETQARIDAISGVTDLITAETEARGKLADRVSTIEGVYVTTVDVIGDADSVAVTQSEDKHTFTLDFSGFVVDGGEY